MCVGRTNFLLLSRDQRNIALHTVDCYPDPQASICPFANSLKSGACLPISSPRLCHCLSFREYHFLLSKTKLFLETHLLKCPASTPSISFTSRHTCSHPSCLLSFGSPDKWAYFECQQYLVPWLLESFAFFYIKRLCSPRGNRQPCRNLCLKQDFHSLSLFCFLQSCLGGVCFFPPKAFL